MNFKGKVKIPLYDLVLPRSRSNSYKWLNTSIEKPFIIQHLLFDIHYSKYTFKTAYALKTPSRFLCQNSY